MRTILSLLAAGVLVVAAGSAHAVTAEFTVDLVLELSDFDPIPFSGGGTGETVGGGGVTLPEGSIVAGFVSRLEEPLLGVIPGFALCGQGQQASTFPLPAAPGAAGAVLDRDPLKNGLLGELVYGGVSEAVGALLATAYLTNAASIPLVSIPLDIIGVGGTLDFLVLGSPATLTANPWTTDEVTVTGGLAGDPPTTLTDSGFDDRDSNGFGQLKLVTSALTSLGASGSVPTIGSLTIDFAAPEPGAGAVGAAAMGALAVLARRRSRRSCAHARSGLPDSLEGA